MQLLVFFLDGSYITLLFLATFLREICKIASKLKTISKSIEKFPKYSQKLNTFLGPTKRSIDGVDFTYRNSLSLGAHDLEHPNALVVPRLTFQAANCKQ